MVDDNALSLKETSVRLRKIGFQTKEIADQSGFLEVLGEVAIDSAPSLVVLDLRLPWAVGVSGPVSIDGGIGCLELLRGEPATAQVPVVIYSAFVDDDLIDAQLRRRGVAAIIDKAVSPERLEVVVVNLFPEQRLRGPARAQRLGRQTEQRLLRWGGVAAALAAVATVVREFVS